MPTLKEWAQAIGIIAIGYAVMILSFHLILFIAGK